MLPTAHRLLTESRSELWRTPMNWALDYTLGFFIVVGHCVRISMRHHRARTLGMEN